MRSVPRLDQLPGVTNVNVELATGGLPVTSDTGVEETSVRTAVAEAGYEIAAPVGQASPVGAQSSGCSCGCG